MTQFEQINTDTPLIVVEGIGQVEKELIGRRFTFCRWDNTHGYAVVTDGQHHWHLHPEALQVLK